MINAQAKASRVDISVSRPTVLWICRHGVLPKQVKVLERIHGENIRYITIEDNNLQLNQILKMIKYHKPTEVVVNLPIWLLEQLVENGIYPLVADLENTDDQSNCDLTYDGYKHRNFIKFQRFMGVEEQYFVSLQNKFIMNPSLGFQPVSDRILLFSYKRSLISAKEKYILEGLYEKKLNYTSVGRNTDIAVLAEQIKKGEFLDVILEAPETVLKKISGLGINPLIPITKLAEDMTVFDIKYKPDSKHEFLNFKRLYKFQIKYADPMTTDINGSFRLPRGSKRQIRTFN